MPGKPTLTLILLLVCTTGFAAGSGYSFTDGHGLLRLCKGEANFDSGACHSYLAGIHDAHGSLDHSGVLTEKSFCTPEGVEVGVLKEAFLTYAATRPELLQRTASSLAIDAYRIAFPCQ